MINDRSKSSRNGYFKLRGSIKRSASLDPFATFDIGVKVAYIVQITDRNKDFLEERFPSLSCFVMAQLVLSKRTTVTPTAFVVEVDGATSILKIQRLKGFTKISLIPYE
jgi:hypothetical protein